MQNALGKDKVVYMGDAFMPDYGADGRIDQATSEALDADVVILFLGTSAINPHTLNTVGTASSNTEIRNDWNNEEVYLHSAVIHQPFNS